MNKKLSFDTFTVTGKRKRALAKAAIKSGSGKIKMNLRPIEFLSDFRRLYIQEPIRLVEGAGMPINFDISVKVTGGGPEGQVEAARLAIARAIVKFTKSPEIRKIFLNYDRNMMIQDTRRKETYKPNDSKARAARQKSYR
jgi:small subunit ribosomal protein S9